MNERAVSQFAGLAETDIPAQMTAREYLSVLEETCSLLETTLANLENRLDFFLAETNTKPASAPGDTLNDSTCIESSLNYRLRELTHYVEGLNHRVSSITDRVR